MLSLGKGNAGSFAQHVLDDNADKAKVQLEAQERIRKAKAKAEIDEAARRRSNRNKKSDDVHSMEKCEDMAKKKNLKDLLNQDCSHTGAVIFDIKQLAMKFTPALAAAPGNPTLVPVMLVGIAGCPQAMAAMAGAEDGGLLPRLRSARVELTHHGNVPGGRLWATSSSSHCLWCWSPAPLHCRILVVVLTTASAGRCCRNPGRSMWQVFVLLACGGDELTTPQPRGAAVFYFG